MAYAHRLDKILKKADSNYYAKTIMIVDGATYHTNPTVVDYMRQIGWNVMVSAPYSYSSAAIEWYFA